MERFILNISNSTRMFDWKLNIKQKLNLYKMKNGLLTISAILSSMALQLQAQNVLFEDFESGAMPAGWSQTTLANDGGYKFGINTVIQSASWPVVAHTKMVGTNDDACNCDKSADRLISPAMDFTGIASVHLSMDMYFQQGTYQGASESLKIEVSTAGAGGPWTTLTTVTGSASWTPLLLDLGAYGNQPSVTISILYNDGAGYLFGAAIDNFRAYQPLAFDVATNSVNLETYFAAGATPVSGTLVNYGGTAITTMDLNYKVDNGSVVTQTVNGLNIAPLASYNYTHPTNWTAVTGFHTVKVWASALNGNADLNAVNDTAASGMVSCMPSVYPRIVLIEQFTSSTCGPCAGANPAFNQLLDNNPSTTAAIKYQMDYPAAGDPCYLAENTTRHNYYGVQGIPHMQMDGKTYAGHPANFNQGILDAETPKTAVYDIDIKWSVVGTKVFVDVTTTSKADILPTSSMKLHVVAVENEVVHSPQSNGETTFHDVNRKMFAGAAGTSLTNQMANQTFTYTGNWTIANVAGAPVVSSDLSIVAFVQDNTSGKVMQAAISLTPNSIKDENGNEQVVSVYPNPFTNTTNVIVSLASAQEVKVDVYNLVGEKVYSVSQGQMAAGVHSVIVEGTNLSSGMYFVNVTAGEKTYTKKVTLNK